jgi:hypothetical protein
VRKLGFVGNISYLSINIENTTAGSEGMLRIDGNLAYAVNLNFNIKGGFNISSFTDKDIYEEYAPSIGLQFGFGTQITQNVGIDVMYVAMQQSQNTFNSDDDDLETRFVESGVELALHATF